MLARGCGAMGGAVGGAPGSDSRRRGRFGRAALAVAVLACGLVPAPAAHAADHHTIVVTFIRHGESAANAQGIIDTSVPGPDLTALGRWQAQQVSDELNVNHYDGIWASTIVRTQQTAAPMSRVLNEPVTVLADLREVEAGTNEGLPVATAPTNSAPDAWLRGRWDVRIPGAANGYEFESRFNDAVATIYRSGGNQSGGVLARGGHLLLGVDERQERRGGDGATSAAQHRARGGDRKSGRRMDGERLGRPTHPGLTGTRVAASTAAGDPPLTGSLVAVTISVAAARTIAL
jgi:broad specificity phosphatase PhoE